MGSDGSHIGCLFLINWGFSIQPMGDQQSLLGNPVRHWLGPGEPWWDPFLFFSEWKSHHKLVKKDRMSKVGFWALYTLGHTLTLSGKQAWRERVIFRTLSNQPIPADLKPSGGSGVSKDFGVSNVAKLARPTLLPGHIRLSMTLRALEESRGSSTEMNVRILVWHLDFCGKGCRKLMGTLVLWYKIRHLCSFLGQIHIWRHLL